MKYKVINIDSWKHNDPNAPEAMNDEILELDEEEGRRGMDFGALEMVEDFLEEIEEVEEVQEVEEIEEVKEVDPEPQFICEECAKVCKSAAGLKAHARSHSNDKK